ncbi:MAG: ABC transporter permease [Caldilineaceae bacterium]
MELTPSDETAHLEAGAVGQRRAAPWLLLLALPILLFLSLPLLALVLRSPVRQLAENLARQEVVQAVQLSLTTSALSTFVTLGLGTPLAYLLARHRFRGRAIMDTLIDLPMILPPAVAGLALLITFGRRGLLGAYLDEVGVSIAFTQAAVVLAQVFVASPFYIKAAISGFAAVDRDLEQAAAIDGANAWRILQHITLPLAWPTLLGGIVMTWARALGEFGATIIFAGNFPGRTQTMPLAIYIGLELDLTIALTLSTMMLIISFLVLFVVKRVLHQRVTTRWQ